MKTITTFATLLVTMLIIMASFGVMAAESMNETVPTAITNPSRTTSIAPVDLGSAGNFTVLAGSAITSAGPSIISGDIGSYPTPAITGFPPGIVVNGTNQVGNALTQQAKTDLTAAYNDAAIRTSTSSLAIEIGGQTLAPGVYKDSGGFSITGTLTLDGQGDPNAVFIFQSATTLITAVSSEVVLFNGTQAENVFWQIGSSVTALGASSTFVGTILAFTSITLNDGANVVGRVLALNAAVTLVSNIVSKPTDIMAPTINSTTPTDTATGVAQGTTIAVQWFEDMDNTNGTVNIIPAPPIAGTWTWSADNIWYNYTDATYASETIYTLTFTLFRDPALNNATGDLVKVFTTADFMAPTILTITPADGATSIAQGTTIAVQWSEDMDNTVGTVGIVPAPPIAGTWTWSADNVWYNYTGATYAYVTHYALTFTNFRDPALNAATGDLVKNFTLIKAMLTVMADAKTKVYGAANPLLTFTYSGWQGSDDDTVLTTKPAASTTVDLLTNVGIQVDAITVSGGVDEVYDFTYVTANFTITTATLTVTANNTAKTYGDSATFIGTEFTTSGLINSDTVTSVTLMSAGAAATAAVNTYTITPSAAVGTGLSNYDITYTTGTMTVTKATLTITANVQTKTYGSTFTFLGTEFTTSGLVNSDTVTSVTLTSAGAAATAAVNTYTITPSAAVGTGLSNYDITYTTGTMTLTKATLTITANVQTKTYGSTFTFLRTEFTTSGLVNSDTVTSVTLASPGSVSTAAVNTYTITPSAAVGIGLSNYDITYTTGTMTVTKATLTITANDQTKTYGSTFTFLRTEFTTSGLVSSDTVASVTFASPGSVSTAAVNTYTITPSAAVGTGLAHYDITYTTGTMAVTKATLTVTCDDKMKTYGQVNPMLTFKYRGFQGTDDDMVLDLIPTITTTAVQFSGLGSYPISVSDGADNNYLFSYVEGILTITQTTPTILGIISGTLVDYDGNPIENATVTLGNTGITTTTDTNGNYSFSDVEPGTYSVGFNATGYEPSAVTIIVDSGQTTTVPETILSPDDGGVSNLLWIIGLIAVALVAVLIGWKLIAKRKKQEPAMIINRNRMEL